MQVINIIFWLMYTIKITIIITKKTPIVCWLQISWRSKKGNYIFWNYTQKDLYSRIFDLQFKKIPWEMPVINIILWLMSTTKVTIIIIKQKNYHCLLVADFTKKGKGELYLLNYIFWNYTQKAFYSYIFIYAIHKNTMRNASNWYNFLVDVHYESYHNYHQQKLLLFVGCRCHEEGKRWMIYFETTHKRLSIHVSAQKKHGKCQ